MAHVLGIQGSPRKKGNTHILVEKVLDGARDTGATTDLIQLGAMTIHDCTGCGTPVYWFGPTALMKAFIDRFVYFNCPESRPMIRGKRAALVVPFEDTDLEAAAPLVAMFERSFAYLEMELTGTLLVPGVGKKGDVLEHPDQLQAAHALGQRLAS